MSKYTDFFPASSGTGFPYTGSGQMTGSLGTDVLLVEGGVEFLYYDRGTTAGWSTLAAALNNSTGATFGAGDYNQAIRAGGLTFVPAPTTPVNFTEIWNGTTWSAPGGTLVTARFAPVVGGSSAAEMAAGQNGATTGNFTNTHEQWNGTAWSTVGTTAPATNRNSLGAVGTYGDFIQFGGQNTGAAPFGVSTETNVWNGTAWTTPGNNLANAALSRIGLDKSTSSGFAIGGLNGAVAEIALVEEYNGVSWSNNSPTTNLNTARRGSASGTTSSGLYSGGDAAGSTETWNGTTWSNQSPTHVLPTATYTGAQVSTDGNLALYAGGATPASSTTSYRWDSSTTSAGLYTTFDYSDTDGTTTVSDLVETSAERFKENIQTLDNQVDKIKQLRPVQYSWKKDKRKDIGFIAEEVEKVYPQLVEKDEKGEVSGMSYSKLAAAVVKTIQEQQEQIAKLNDELDNIK
jgi:hypothetical protein